MSGRLQRYQTVNRWAQQLEQPCISRRVFTERTGATRDLALLIEHRHYMTLAPMSIPANRIIPPPSFIRFPLPRSRNSFLLVHSRTLFAPLDTVRALSPDEGANLEHKDLPSARAAATPLRKPSAS